MSTTDPAVRRHDDIVAARGSSSQLWLSILGLGLLAIGGAAIGASASILVEELRHSVIDDAFDDRATLLTQHPFSVPACLVGGMVAVGSGVVLYGRAILRYRGGEHPWPVRAATAIVGASCGFIALVPGWLAPLEVGTSIDPAFGDDSSWGAGAWILYRSSLWLPALFLLGSAVAVWGSLHANRIQRTAAHERDRLLTMGRRTPGVVQELAVRTSTDDNGSRRVVGAKITVRFTDAAGTVRYLERFMAGSASDVSRISTAEVLHDPLQPDATTSMFVTFRNPPLPSDWIGPSAAERRNAR